MKKYILLATILLAQCVSKTENKTETAVVPQKPNKLIVETENQIISNQKEVQEKVFEIEDKDGFVYDPYDFPLEEEVVKALLHNNVEVKKKFVPESEYGDSYTHITIKHTDAELSFYDYGGKHQARISTAKLPLWNGIVIGMQKKEFLTKMELSEESAKAANIFSVMDEHYGEFSFYFRKDTLYLIKGYYEEGD